MSAPTNATHWNATHWVSGTVSGSLTTDRIRKLHGDRGIAAFVVSERDAASVSRDIAAKCPLGAEMTFAVVAIDDRRRSQWSA